MNAALPPAPADAPATTGAGRGVIPPPNRTGTVVELLLGSEGGGIVTAIRQWAPTLIQAGWDLRFVLLAEDKAAQMLRDAGFEPIVHALSKSQRYRRLPGILQQMNASIIHVHNPSAHLVGAHAARKINARLVRTVHADMFNEMKGTLPAWKIALWRLLMARELRRADAVCSVSPHLVPLLPGMSGRYADRVRIMPNGYDPNPLLADDTPLPPELQSWLGSAPLILSMGRLVTVKNYPLLLEAFAAARRSVPETRLLLAGSGPLEEQLRSQAKRLNLGDSFRLLPWVDRIAPLLKRATLVAISSRSECCPMLVLEAMAVSRPVVSTRVGGVPWMIDETIGRLVDPNRPEPLAEAFVEVLSNPQLADRLGAASHTRLWERYSHETAARDLAGVFNEVAGRRTP